MNHLNKSVLCLGLLAGMLTVGADSIATTSSSLAIGSCQHAAYAGGVIEFGFNGLYNTSSTENAYVDCSPDDKVSTATFANNAHVWVDDLNSSTNVTCNFEIMQHTTGLLSYDGGQKSSTSTGTGIELFWTKTFMPLSYTGKPYFSCKIPPTSGGNASGIHGLAVGQG